VFFLFFVAKLPSPCERLRVFVIESVKEVAMSNWASNGELSVAVDPVIWIEATGG